MIALFKAGQPQTITDVLANRDQRAQLQNEWAQQCQSDEVLVALKLNIPGPIKNNADLTRLFQSGLTAFQKRVNVRRQLDWQHKTTGPETFLLLTGEAQAIKQQAVQFEDQHPLGRLFDVDVLVWQAKSQQAQPVSRQLLGEPERQCLLCTQPAKVCARSRQHTVQALQAAINQRYQAFME